MSINELLENAKVIPFNEEMTRAIVNGNKTQTRRVIKSKATSCFELGVPCIKVNLDEEYKYSIREKGGAWNDYKTDSDFIKKYSKYQVGDILWVREPAFISDFSHTRVSDSNEFTVTYKADNKINFFEITEDLTEKSWLRLNHGIPNGCLKKMARTFLKVTNIKIEKLNDIAPYDIESEGFPDSNLISEYDNLMSSINALNLNIETWTEFYSDMEGYKESVDSWKETLEDETKTKSLYEDKFIDWWKKLWDSNANKGYKSIDNPYVFVYEFERIK